MSSSNVEWFHNKTYYFNDYDEIFRFMKKQKFDYFYTVGGENPKLIYCRFGKKISFLRKLLTK